MIADILACVIVAIGAIVLPPLAFMDIRVSYRQALLGWMVLLGVLIGMTAVAIALAWAVGRLVSSVNA